MGLPCPGLQLQVDAVNSGRVAVAGRVAELLGQVGNEVAGPWRWQVVADLFSTEQCRFMVTPRPDDVTSAAEGS